MKRQKKDVKVYVEGLCLAGYSFVSCLLYEGKTRNRFLQNVQFFIFLVDILMKKKVNKILAAFEINVWN